MAICRFLARELGLAGNNNSEAARVDEVVDAIQDAVDATVRIEISDFLGNFPIFSSFFQLKYTGKCDKDKKKLLTELTTVTYPDVLVRINFISYQELLNLCLMLRVNWRKG